MNSELSTRTTLHRRFFIPLAVIGFIAILDHTVVVIHSSHMESDARIINVAGRQRMLATRLVNEAGHVVTDRHTGEQLRTAQTWLISTADTLHQQHDELAHLDTPFIRLPAVQRIYLDAELDADTHRLIEAARRLAAATAPDEDNPDYRQILALAPAIISRTEHAVTSYESAARRRVHILMTLEVVALLITLAILLFIARHVFRPMAARIRADMANLEQVGSELAHKNTELARRMAQLEHANRDVTRFRDRLHAILESAGEGICGLDDHGRVSFANATALRLLGITDGTLHGEALADYCVEGCLQNGPASMRRRDGSLFHAAITVTPLHQAGSSAGVVVVFADVSERHRAEQALERERQFTATIVDTMGSLLVVLDREGRIVRFNRRCEEVTGYSSSEVHGRPLWELFIVPEERDVVQATFNKLNAGHFPNQHENHWLTRSGERRLISWSNSALLDADGSPEFVIATGLDITESRHLRQALGDSEIRYRSLITHASEAIALIDIDGRLLELNEVGEQLSGYPKDELRGHPFLDLLRADQHDRTLAAFTDVLANGTGSVSNAVLITRSGDERYIDVTASLIPMGDASVVQAIARDITERKRHEESLALAAQVFEASGDGIMITDAKSNILQVNRAFEIITGYARAEVLGQTPRILRSGRMPEDFYAELWRSLQSMGRWQGELWNRRKNGEVYPEWVTIDRLTDERGTVRNYVAVFRDITAHKRMEENLRHLASYDTLTELPNRSLLQDRVEQAFAHARRTGTKVVLMLLDLDRFKHINDTLGHQVGDELLKQAAARLRNCVRDSDTVARLGGDEFTVLLQGLGDVARTATVARKIMTALNRPFELQGAMHVISTSIGISAFPEAADATALLRQADIAMYAAKRAGGNGFRYYEPGMEERATTEEATAPSPALG